VHRDTFRKNNQLDTSISKIYFCHKTLHVSGIFCAHHQGLSTVNTAIGTLHAGYVSQVRLFQPDSARKRSHNLHDAYQLPCLQWITPDDGHRRCPKHVGFYDKNKLWILMHLVGYFYETYHDARPPEHKVLKCCWYFFYMHSVICILTAQHDQMWSKFKFTSMGTQDTS
jgi:hypothetical protein